MGRTPLPITAVTLFIALMAIGIGLRNIYLYDAPTNFTELFFGASNGQYHDMIEIPIPGTVYLFPILPISALILGSFLILFWKKWGWRGLPLVIMAAGIYDITSQYQPPIWTYRILAGQNWAEAQALELVAGFLLAGAPRFKATMFLPVVILAYTLVSSTPYYDGYLFCLCLYLYTSIGGFHFPRPKWSVPPPQTEDVHSEISA